MDKMQKKHLALIIFLLFQSLTSLKAKVGPFIAEVSIVRGRVTLMAPGLRSAIVLKKGKKLRRDSSILTGKNSFVRIKFFDGSLASLGPESKMVVNETGKTNVGLISLVKGKLRTKIEKGKNARPFFIKTRTAALGVRGTEFQTLYNKKNRVTSLLTYEGKVQIAKVEKRDPSQPRVVPKTNEEYLIQKQDEMNGLLKSKKSVGVNKGQYSGTSPKVQKTSLPVKISPVQFTALYKNDELKDESDIEKSVKKDGVLIDQVEQRVPLEGFRNRRTGDFAPRSGGYLDFNSGLYVPPTFRSTFNERLGVYEDKNIGSFNSKTGEYKPPAGMVLDSNKGFILDKLSSIGDTLKKSVRNLNRNMELQSPLLKEADIVKKKKLAKKKKIRDFFLKDEVLIKSNLFEFDGQIGTESISFKGTTASGLKSWSDGGYKRMNFTLFHGGHKKVQMVTSFAIGQMDSGTMEESGLHGLNFGARIKFNNLGKLSFSTITMGFEEKHFLFTPTDFSDSNVNYYLKSIFVPQLEGNAYYKIWERKRFAVGALGKLRYLFHSRADSGLSASGGIGFGGSLKMKWGILPGRLWLDGGVWIDSESQKVNGPMEEFTQGRTKLGLNLKLLYVIR